MEVSRLTEKELMDIYNGRAADHFPAEERKESATILRLLREGVYEGLGFYKENKLSAYAFFVRPEGSTVALLDYYAVMEEHRSGGIGSLFLQEMKEYYRNLEGLLIETEALEASISKEEYETRIRRNAFYSKNGAGDTGVRSEIAGVAYWIWFLPIRMKEGAAFNKGIIQKELEKIYNIMFHGKKEDLAKFWLKDEK